MTTQEFDKRIKYNNGADRQIGLWKILDIHQIPDTLSEQHEVDFYCCNGKTVCLLRLRNRMNEKYIISSNKNDSEPLPYWIAELPIKKIDNDFIRQILEKFEALTNDQHD